MSLAFVVTVQDGQKKAFGSEEVAGAIYDYEYGPDDMLFGKKVADLQVGTYDKNGILQK